MCSPEANHNTQLFASAYLQPPEPCSRNSWITSRWKHPQQCRPKGLSTKSMEDKRGARQGYSDNGAFTQVSLAQLYWRKPEMSCLRKWSRFVLRWGQQYWLSLPHSYSRYTSTRFQTAATHRTRHPLLHAQVNPHASLTRRIVIRTNALVDN